MGTINASAVIKTYAAQKSSFSFQRPFHDSTFMESQKLEKKSSKSEDPKEFLNLLKEKLEKKSS